ncbi:MAG: TIGR03067 domain-containing protein [Gemmataceae bacterium]
MRGEDHSRLEDFWDEPAPHERPNCPDTQALQGAWGCVAGRRPAVLLVAGDRYTVHFADGDIYMGTFTLGGDGWPCAIDLHIEQGPSRHKGLATLGVYEFDGDTLRWCIAAPGQPERPTAFIELDPRHLCLVFRREHPTGMK